MKNIFFFIFMALIFISCNNSKEIKKEEVTEIPDTSSVEEIAPIEESFEEEVEFKNNFDILLLRSYRDWEGKNEANSLTKNWIDLNKKGDKYFLSKADYKRKSDYDPCTGDSTKVIESKNKTLLFMDFPELKLGEIKSLKISKKKIWPKEKTSFTYNDIEYFLRAEGKVLSSEKVHTDEGSEIFQVVENYKLYISTKDIPEKLLLKEESFNDTFVELLFAGDIDQDGKLDFIFQANRNYEEERVILFLSSKAEKENVVKKVSEIAIQFDC